MRSARFCFALAPPGKARMKSVAAPSEISGALPLTMCGGAASLLAAFAATSEAQARSGSAFE